LNPARKKIPQWAYYPALQEELAEEHEIISCSSKTP